MLDDEVWRVWRSSKQLFYLFPALGPSVYLEIDELILVKTAGSPKEGMMPGKMQPRYTGVGASQLQKEAEEFLRKGRPLSAVELYEQALLLLNLEPGPDPSLKGQLLTGYARALLQKGDRKEAEEYFLRALALAREEKNLPLEQEAFYGIGLVYQKAGNTYLAADNFRSALNLARDGGGNLSGETSILVVLGRAYLDQGKLDKAAACFLKARNLYRENDKNSTGGALNSGKQGELAVNTFLQEVLKQAKKINAVLGEKQFNAWVADFEAGTLLPG